MITRTSFPHFFLKALLLEGEETDEEPHRVGSSDTLLSATLELSGRMNGLHNLQSFREREYVRIENVFILELVVWPFGSIVVSLEPRRRGNTSGLSGTWEPLTK